MNPAAKLGAVVAVTAALVLPSATTASAALTVSPVRSNAVWNGYVLAASSLKASYVDLVQANWTVPKMSCTKGEDGPSAAQWVGLGGDSSDFSPLLQIGVWSQCLSENGKEVQGDSPVWEEIQSDIWPFPTLTDAHPSFGPKADGINAGDSVSAAVGFDRYAAKPYELSLEDITRHWTWNLNESSPLDTTYPQTAEWIVENPYTPPPALANFRTVSFTDMATELNGVDFGYITDAAIFRLYSLPRVVNVSPVSNATGKLTYIGLGLASGRQA